MKLLGTRLTIMLCQQIVDSTSVLSAMKSKTCTIGKCTSPTEYQWIRKGRSFYLCHACYEMLGGKRERFVPKAHN